MNTISSDSLRVLFDAVLEIPPGERAAYLQAHCPDAALRTRVLELLEADARTSDSLQRDWVERIAQGLGDGLLPRSTRLRCRLMAALARSASCA